jgi:YfiH family protein
MTDTMNTSPTATHLPRPAEGFEWRATAVAPALVCTALDVVAPHLFTTRGFLLGSTRSGDEPWRQLSETIGGMPLLRLRQVHGAASVIAAVPLPEAPPEGDILLAGPDGPAIAVQGADCVPLLIADRRRGVVAAAHAGWRGLVQRVPGETVRRLKDVYGSEPTDLVAAIGPSVGACCYEVGPDVRAAFEEAAFPAAQVDPWFHTRPQPTALNPSMEGLPVDTRPGHAYFDGWACATGQLVAAGIPASAVFCAALCTASHPDVLCSYRRDRSYAGRIAGVIVPRPPR